MGEQQQHQRQQQHEQQHQHHQLRPSTGCLGPYQSEDGGGAKSKPITVNNTTTNNTVVKHDAADRAAALQDQGGVSVDLVCGAAPRRHPGRGRVGADPGVDATRPAVRHAHLLGPGYGLFAGWLLAAALNLSTAISYNSYPSGTLPWPETRPSTRTAAAYGRP